MPYISVEDVVKDYKIYEKKPGAWNTVKSVFVRPYSIRRAVDHISFTAERGELIGYIGPNGAGKSTTLKMLSGILYPTQGRITVDGREPYKNRKENSMHMGVVFGQRSQLFWDLPMEDTFGLYKKIYKLDDAAFRRNVEFYVGLLGMQDFLKQPVRQLSLGQKMRANIAVALLHDPDIVYLDEPTIGLDVVAKNKIRHFIRAVNAEKHTTVILTTHDMDDIEAICRRLIMIDEGRLLYDGSLPDFKRRYSGDSVLILEFEPSGPDGTCGPDGESDEDYAPDPSLPIELLRREGSKCWYRYDRDRISPAEVAWRVAGGRRLANMEMQDADIEYIVRSIYEKQAAARG